MKIKSHQIDDLIILISTFRSYLKFFTDNPEILSDKDSSAQLRYMVSRIDSLSHILYDILDEIAYSNARISQNSKNN